MNYSRKYELPGLGKTLSRESQIALRQRLLKVRPRNTLNVYKIMERIFFYTSMLVHLIKRQKLLRGL